MSDLEEFGTTETSVEVTPTVTDVEVPTELSDPAVDDAPKYRVKVAGEELEVTLEELQKGYSRQQDYTSKTQQLAQEKARLRDAEALTTALERDPQSALAALAEAYGIRLGQQQEQDSWLDEMDPMERKIAELESWKQQQEASRIKATVDAQVAQLVATDPSLDPQQLFAYAVKNEIRDLGIAYKAMVSDQLREELAAAKKAQMTEAKRELGALSGGASKQAGVSTVAVQKPTSVADAWRQAKQSLGIS